MYLSEMGVSHRIVDRRGTRTLTGRADGFHVPTVEIWDSFDMADKLDKLGKYGELAIWTFGEGHDGIARSQRSQLATDMPDYALPSLHQGFIEAALGHGVRQRSGPRVERGTKPVSMEVSEAKAHDQAAYPVTVEIRHSHIDELDPPFTGAHSIQQDGTSRPERGYVDGYGLDPEEIEQHVNGEQGTTERVHAKYMIGTDGAHSWVRQQLPDFEMEGDTSDAVFGVIDIIPLTNFPDIRKVGTILAKAGFMLIIPRELGMVRLYVQLPEDYSEKDKTTAPNRDDASICAEILAAARKVLDPYTMDYKYCDWWTVYRVGQRVCNHASYQDRVFLAGDAIHTHSPKGGQGMNISQQDTYNLSWKLVGVLRGQLSPSVLSTYESERLPIARNLIAWDKHMAELLTARINRDEDAVRKGYNDLQELNRSKLCCQPNPIQAADGDSNGTKQDAAAELRLGLRFKNTPVYSQAHGNVEGSLSLLKSTGQWRLFVFAGDVSDSAQLSKVNALGSAISQLTQRYPSASARKPNWLHTILVHSAKVSALEITDFHDAYFPRDEVYGRQYHNIYADFPDRELPEGFKGAHEVYGVDKRKGALVVVRPDQIVSWVGYLDDFERLEEWLAGFMLAKNKVADAERRDSGQGEKMEKPLVLTEDV